MNRMGGCGLNLCGSKLGRISGSCVSGYEPLVQ
jgi:hypothetical protein